MDLTVHTCECAFATLRHCIHSCAFDPSLALSTKVRSLVKISKAFGMLRLKEETLVFHITWLMILFAHKDGKMHILTMVHFIIHRYGLLQLHSRKNGNKKKALRIIFPSLKGSIVVFFTKV